MTAILTSQTTDTKTAGQQSAGNSIVFVVTGIFGSLTRVFVEVSIDNVKYAPIAAFDRPGAVGTNLDSGVYWRVVANGLSAATPISVDANI